MALGIPNALGVFMETSLFGFIIVFITKFGTETIAAHQAALNFLRYHLHDPHELLHGDDHPRRL